MPPGIRLVGTKSHAREKQKVFPELKTRNYNRISPKKGNGGDAGVGDKYCFPLSSRFFRANCP